MITVCMGKWAFCEVRVGEPWFVAFADFHGVETSTLADFRIPRV